MDILCLMGLFPHEYKSEIERHSVVAIQNAANKLQWEIVNGLDNIEDVNVKILNSLYIGSFPKKYKKLIIPSFKFKHNKEASDYNVGFINLPGVKQVSRYFSLKKEIKKWLKEQKKDSAILAYAMTNPFVDILAYVKKVRPDIPVCLIVPDLPEYMDMSKKNSLIYNFLKKVQIHSFHKKIYLFDAFVLLTKYMKRWFREPILYTVIEGIASEELIQRKNLDRHEKSILYAGGLTQAYGVIDLADAFTRIDNEEWTLEIYGDGEAQQILKKYARKDRRIHINGVVTNSEIVEKQLSAGILVNPRRNEQKFTKYSFPSKIIEYMSSGTPVIAYKLDGMPNEYMGYFYQVEDGKDGLKNTIEKVIQLSEEERNAMGVKAKNFIKENKVASSQGKKIYDLLKKCREKI